MSSFIIEGGHKLSGEIEPQGAKNETLQIIAATLLTSEPVTITNVPEILDVCNLIELLKGLGVKVTRHSKGNYTFQADNVDINFASSREFVKKSAGLRGSVLVVGPLLGRFGSAYLPNPAEIR